MIATNKSKDFEEEFKKVQTTEELKTFVSHNYFSGRTLYVVRVFYCLQYVKKHPEAMEEVGTSWCENGNYFISNSKKLGDFLSLKSNTINTNFRDHGFKIVGDNAELVKNHFSNLSDRAHWKIRFHELCKFNCDSNIDEVKNIKKISENQDEHPIPVDNDIDFIPPETRNLLSNDQSQIIYISQLYYSISSTKEFFIKFLRLATQLWTQRISVDTFISYFKRRF